MIIGTRELALLIGTLTYEPTLTIEPPELGCLTRAIYHEARGESPDGMTAVGYVILRRLALGRWGTTICEVVEAPDQFSWHSDGKPDAPADLGAYRVALHAAVQVLTGRAEDTSRLATHYYAHALTTPAWAASLIPTAIVGGHTFLTNCESEGEAPVCSFLPRSKGASEAPEFAPLPPLKPGAEA